MVQGFSFFALTLAFPVDCLLAIAHAFAGSHDKIKSLQAAHQTVARGRYV